MKKILVVPNKKNIDILLNMNIDGIILPIKDLSCNYEDYFDIDDVKKILNTTSKEISVVINKIFHNKDLNLLEYTLSKLNKLNINKILFYDMGLLNICKRLNMHKELVIYQEHLNASTLSNNFYKRRGINYTVITNDITKEEINEISKHIDIILPAYGYIPIFYSRRYLISNYLKYVKKIKHKNIYYIRHDNDLYPIKEEDEGTVIYTKKPINLINEIDDINCKYIILNSFNIEESEFINVVSDYINGNKVDNKDNYLGFLNKKTVYKVSDYDE